MTRLSFVRHGPTHAKGMVGWSDLPADLSDHAALARLSAALPEEALVVSSDLTRAVTTADVIAGARTRLPHDPGLREIHFGDWELLRWDQIPPEEVALSRRFWEAPGAVQPPGGESWDGLTARVTGAVDALMAAHPGRDLVIVAHFGAILTQIARAAGMSARESFAHRLEPLSLSEVTRHAGGWEVHRINHIS